MGHEQNDLDHDIPAEVEHWRDEDLSTSRRYVYEERRQLEQSIRTSIPQCAKTADAELGSKTSVMDACIQVSAHISQSTKRSSALHRLIEALHHSRRLQAMVVIRQHEHLVDPDCGYDLPIPSTKGSLANVGK